MDNERNVRSTRGQEPQGTSRVGAAAEDARETVRDGAQNIGSIVGEIVEDLQNMVRGEVQLAKTEMKEEASQMGRGAGMIGAGVFFGLIGFIFLMLAVTYLLNKWIEMWMAAGIVGLALVIIAGILAMAGKGQIQDANLTPDQTIDSLKEDKEWANRQMNSVKK